MVSVQGEEALRCIGDEGIASSASVFGGAVTDKECYRAAAGTQTWYAQQVSQMFSVVRPATKDGH